MLIVAGIDCVLAPSPFFQRVVTYIRVTRRGRCVPLIAAIKYLRFFHCTSSRWRSGVLARAISLQICVM